MMGEFEEKLREGFIEACLHLVNRDFDALAKDFVTLGYYNHLSRPFAAKKFFFLICHKACLNSAGFFHQLQRRRLLQKL